MKKLMTILVAALALALVAFTPDLASAGHGHGGGRGWHGGGGHWRGGHAWRGGRGWHGGWHGHRGWYGYRGWRGYGWGGWWGPGINIYVGWLRPPLLVAGLRLLPLPLSVRLGVLGLRLGFAERGANSASRFWDRVG